MTEYVHLLMERQYIEGNRSRPVVRGVFASEEAAEQWADEHLDKTDRYSVQRHEVKGGG